MSKKKLDETTYTHSYTNDGFGVVGDDDFPPGNIVFGDKYNRKMVTNRLTGAYPNFYVDASDWKWDVFSGSKGMESKENYSDTLDKFAKKNSPIKRDDFDIWKHVKTRSKDSKWAPEKEKLREPEQKGNPLKKDASSNMDDPKNPATGEDDDKVIKKVNKHLQKEK